MNFTFVVLGVLVIILIYIVYVVTLFQLTSLATYVNLDVSSSLIPIAYQPHSSQYTYNLLIYVAPTAVSNLKSTVGTSYNIFRRGSDTLTSTTYFDNVLSLDITNIETVSVDSTNNKPFDTYNLTCSIYPQSGNGPPKPYTILTILPINQWMYVSITMDGAGIASFYIDGKLTNSVKTGVKQIAQYPNPNIKLGKMPAYIQSFTCFPYAFSAIEVYNSYFGLNSGIMYIYKMLTAYTVDVSLVKNDKVVTTQTIL